jgi:hypothetical protein
MSMNFILSDMWFTGNRTLHLFIFTKKMSFRTLFCGLQAKTIISEILIINKRTTST